MIDYCVLTKRLHEQVKRNWLRLPEDLMFQLARAEVEAMNRSPFATGSQFWSLVMRRLRCAS